MIATPAFDIGRAAADFQRMGTTVQTVAAALATSPDPQARRQAEILTAALKHKEATHG